MTDLHTTVIRIAASQPMTLRGLTLRIPAARSEAAQTIDRLIKSGSLTVNSDGIVTLPTAPPSNYRDPHRKRNDGVTRAMILRVLAYQALTTREISEYADVSLRVAQQHLINFMRSGLVSIVGERPRQGQAGAPYKLYRATDDGGRK